MHKPKKVEIPENQYPTRKEMTDIGFANGENKMYDEFMEYFKHLLSKIPSDEEQEKHEAREYASAYYQGKFDVLMDLLNGVE